MQKVFVSTKLLLVITSLCSLLVACKKDKAQPDSSNKPDIPFIALTDNNQLIQFNAKNAASAIATISITGLQVNEKILSVDYRPATGQLYALGNSNRIYVIDTKTGVAHAIGATAFTPAIDGTVATIDFNPTVDRLRLITNTGQNLRLNPETGVVAATDGVINGVVGATIVGASYTNSMAGASATVLYDIDAATDKLYRQDLPNDGTLVEIGSLGVDVSGAVGLDIAVNGITLAALTVNGVAGLYEISLGNGKATLYNNFPAGTKIIGLAIPTPPVAYAIDIDNNLLIFDPAKPQASVSKAITGMQIAEEIMGMDMRPANGQLYGITNLGRLFTINMSSGAATIVNINAPSINLVATDIGFDFNPTVDRIRVVNSNGQNLRLNPNDALLVATDAVLNPGTPAITAIAYTNNFAGATTTVLFDIDTNTGKLYRQDPPNNGTLTEIGVLGINVTNLNGFDIGGSSGIAYATLTVNGTNAIYTINLTTGIATKLADFSKTVQAMAVGLGF